MTPPAIPSMEQTILASMLNDVKISCFKILDLKDVSQSVGSLLKYVTKAETNNWQNDFPLLSPSVICLPFCDKL